jgi:purine-nucleoside phosphorylase
MIGTDKIPERCIICAGTTKEEWIEKILPIFDSFERIACRSLGCFYSAKYKGKKIMLAFNVIGSPASMRLTEILTQNGAKRIIFIGWAGGYKNDIGEFVIPSKTYCADGITTIMKPGIKFAYPDKNLSWKVKGYLDRKGVKYTEGVTYCVIYPHKKFYDKRIESQKGAVKPLAVEMELAPYFFIARKNKAPVAAMLVVSDTKGKSANTGTNQKIRVESQKRAIRYAAEILTEKP